MSKATDHPSKDRVTEASADVQTQGTKPWIAALLLFTVVLLTFLPATRNGFVNYDDTVYVTENGMVQKGLKFEGVRWAFRSTAGSNWHPVTWLSHMLDCTLFGLKPGGHHFMSALLHAVNAALVFMLFRRMTGATWASLAVAALFGLHPLRVESVVWASERKDVLCAFFALLALLAYAKYTTESIVQGPRSKVWYVTALLCFALGLMSKPMLVTLPFVMLLLDFWPLNRVPRSEFRVSSWQPLVVEKLPFFALTVAASFVTYVVQHRTGAMAETLPLDARLANAVVAYARYLGKCLWPTDLCVHYPHPDYWPGYVVAGCAVILAVITGLVLWQGRTRFYLVVGWLWYLGTAVPVIGLVQVGSQSMADRYTYVPFLGLSLISAWGAQELAARRSRNRFAGPQLVIAAALACIPLTYRQIRYWQDSETLFRRALAVTKNNAVAHGSLARALLEKGQTDEAIQHYQEAVRLQPKDTVARNGLGTLLMQKGQMSEAAAQFEAALRTRPNDVAAHNNLGLLLARQGRYPEALAQFELAVQADPNHVEAQHNLGLLLAGKGELAEAIRHYREAIRLKPNYAKAWKNLGVAYAKQQHWEEAITSFQRALQIQPDYAEARQLLQQAQLAQSAARPQP